MSLRPNPTFLLACAALALALPAGSRAQDVDVSGTMPEDGLPALRPILEAAMKQAPGMIQNDISIAQAEAGVYSNDHSLWPGIGANAQYGVNRESTTGGARSNASGFYYSVGANQPVFQWGALENQARIGRIGLLIAKRSYADAYRQLAVSLREQFMGLIQKKISLRNARYSLRLEEGAFEIARERYGRGEISQDEKSSAGGAIHGTKLSIERLEDDYETSMRAFADLAGMPSIRDEDIPATIPKATYNPDGAKILLSGFLRDHAESTFQAQVYQMQIRQAELGYKIAKVNLLPKFGIGTGYSVSNSVTAYPGQITQSLVNSFTYDANVSWNIFDGFATRGAKLSALASKRSAQQQLRNYVKSTEEQARHMVREMEIAAQVQDDSDAGWSYWQDHIKEQSSEVKMGNLPPNAYETAMASYYDAEYSCVTAHVNLYEWWLEFVSLLGRDPALNHLPPSYVRENP